MRERIVFLDRSTLGAPVRRPSFDHEWIEYPATDVVDVVKRLGDATIAITNKVPLTAQALSKLPKLRLIAMAATGYDVIDINYCQFHGVSLVNVRNYATCTVPEHTFALILALRRNLIAYRDDVENGRWERERQFCFYDHPIRDLHGATIGIVGAGSIGQATGAIARGFGMRVLFCDHDRRRIAPGSELAELEVVLKEADIVSLHLPLTSQTKNLIGMDELRVMKRTALLINTARGGLVDESALASALKSGLIAGAGFDVLTSEPPKHGNPLLNLRLPNFILTPHIAWASANAMDALAEQLVGNIEAFVKGSPKNVVV